MSDVKGFSISPHVLAQEVGEEVVILDLSSGTYFGLDAVGSRIWRLGTGGKNLAEICEALLDEYEAPREQVESDTVLLMEELRARNLIV